MATFLGLPKELRQHILEHALCRDPSGTPAATFEDRVRVQVGDLRLHRKNGAPSLAHFSLHKGFPPPAAHVCRSLRSDALEIWGRLVTITIPFPLDHADTTFFNDFIDAFGHLVSQCRLWNIWSAFVFLKGIKTLLGNDPGKLCAYECRTRQSIIVADVRDKVVHREDFHMQKLDAMVKERLKSMSEDGQREGLTPVEIKELYFGPLRAMGLDSTNWKDATEPATRFWAFGSCRKDAPLEA